jgi:hypothetical protein
MNDDRNKKINNIPINKSINSIKSVNNNTKSVNNSTKSPKNVQNKSNIQSGRFRNAPNKSVMDEGTVLTEKLRNQPPTPQSLLKNNVLQWVRYDNIISDTKEDILRRQRYISKIRRKQKNYNTQIHDYMKSINKQALVFNENQMIRLRELPSDKSITYNALRNIINKFYNNETKTEQLLSFIKKEQSDNQKCILSLEMLKYKNDNENENDN